MARRSNNLLKSTNDMFQNDDNYPFRTMYSQNFGDPQLKANLKTAKQNYNAKTPEKINSSSHGNFKDFSPDVKM